MAAPLSKQAAQAQANAVKEAEKPATLLTALLAVQGELPKLQKTAVNPAFKSKYVTLDTIMEAVLPVLNKHKLVWITLPGADQDGHPILDYRLFHAESGDAITGTMPLLLTKQDPQGLGSSLTYAKRQTITAVLGLSADEDDDGNKASQPARAPAAPRAPRPAPQAPPQTLSEASRQKVVEAIEAAGQKVPLVLASIGADSLESLTPDDTYRIRDLLDKAGK